MRWRIRTGPLIVVALAALRAGGVQLPVIAGEAHPGNAGAVSGKAKHWSFECPTDPALPAVIHVDQVRSPVDRFILARLEQQGLSPSRPADKRTLIRRATFDLIGLPPSPEEVEAFEADPSPDAFARVVDRLLASPRYGERWGRYWLDVARYADTKGYVFEEERRFPYAYAYRDWVIRAFNEDLPYDQFLVQQIAGDCLPDEKPQDLAAEGFLTLGRRFLNNPPDIIDDRIDVVCRGTMALTVSCARCHDHKFDPIPTADYYSLYGVFNNSPERQNPPLLGPPADTPEYQSFIKKLEAAQGELDAYRKSQHEALVASLRSAPRIADYLLAAQFPGRGDNHSHAQGAQLNGRLIERWRARLARAEREKDRIFAAWRAYAVIPAADFEAKAPAVTDQLCLAASDSIHPLVAEEFAGSPPASMREVAERYGALLADADGPDTSTDPDIESLRLVLRGPQSPASVALSDLEDVISRDVRERLVKLRNKIATLQATDPGAPPRAMCLEDAAHPEPQHVFLRGNPQRPGEEVPRQLPALLAGPDRKPFQQGSGRLELARAIASRSNPLTARVLVNRVWLHHFGAGLVRTPSDFGTRSDPPTHPELLDYLALRFMESGWSIKSLHRSLMLSATYQQASDDNPDARAIDPENALLWRMNRQRLDFEATRDSLLFVTGKLDTTLGGRSLDITGPESFRRTVYGFIDRQNLPSMFRTFDFATPDSTCPRRFTTTVPQQALFMMNSPFVRRQAEAVVKRTAAAEAGDPARVAQLYQILFNRAPTADEVELGVRFVQAQAPPAPAWQFGYGAFENGEARFHPLRAFVRDGWQAGAVSPDPQLGWVRIDAAGGHPGNNLQDAAIRRWVAPADGSVRISGALKHPETRGDGVRGRIVSSRMGELAMWNVFHTAAQTVIESIDVRKGDTLDFVVDCRGEDQYDSFTWAPVVSYVGTGAGGEGRDTWDAAADFNGASEVLRMGPWEKYAQVLLELNEFVFVD